MYAFPTGGEYPYDWRGDEFFYDLLNSFHNQPVFNSENHIIPDGTGPTHVSPQHTVRGAVAGSAVHHQGVMMIWVWESRRSVWSAASISAPGEYLCSG